MACDAGHLRVWLGVFDAEPPHRLEWSLDGAPVPDEDVVARRPLELARSGAPEIVSRTGVFDLEIAGARKAYDVAVRAIWPSGRTETSNVLSTWPLPRSIPTGLGETFNVLLVSCFYEPNDGGIGDVVASSLKGPNRPDLVLTVGDQVYLDNPWAKAFHWTETGFAKSFELKYRKNWQGSRYANILRAGPVAGIPDDHEYWNNYPQPGIIWPMTNFGSVGRDNWERAARSMFDAFQLAEPDRYSYELDVEPLSFFMMDNRTFRQRDTIFVEARTLRPRISGCSSAGSTGSSPATTLLPILVTGPSLFQPPKRFWREGTGPEHRQLCGLPGDHGRPDEAVLARPAPARPDRRRPLRTGDQCDPRHGQPGADLVQDARDHLVPVRSGDGSAQAGEGTRQPVHGRRDRLDPALFADVADHRSTHGGQSCRPAQIRPHPDRCRPRHHLLAVDSDWSASGRNSPRPADPAAAVPRFDHRLGV